MHASLHSRPILNRHVTVTASWVKLSDVVECQFGWWPFELHDKSPLTSSKNRLISVTCQRKRTVMQIIILNHPQLSRTELLHPCSAQKRSLKQVWCFSKEVAFSSSYFFRIFFLDKNILHLHNSCPSQLNQLRFYICSVHSKLYLCPNIHKC